MTTIVQQPPPTPTPTPPQITLTVPSTSIHSNDHTGTLIIIKTLIIPIITRCHAGYFRITLSLCCQTLLWKTLKDPPENAHAYRRILGLFPSTAFLLLWSLSLLILTTLSILYILRCALFSNMVKTEYLNHIGVNYLFAPWISWLLLLQTAPFLTPKTVYYLLLWWLFVVPIFVLDVKIYGQWFTKGKRILSRVANPASQLSVVGNFVGARAAAQMGWKESAMVLFTLGMVHYMVVFVTLYQRLSGNTCLPTVLRPVMFLFIAAPSMASLAWDEISGTFDFSSKMLFYLSMFLFLCLEETVDHLVCGCMRSRSIWKIILNWLKLPVSTEFRSCKEVLEFVNKLTGSSEWKKIINMSIQATIWNIWKARNDKEFEGYLRNDNEITELIKMDSFIWLKSRSAKNIVWERWADFNIRDIVR